MRSPENFEVVERLAELLDVPASSMEVSAEPVIDDGEHRREIDLQVEADGRKFLIEVKKTATAATIASASRQLRVYTYQTADDAIVILAVHYMPEAGRKLCAEAGINWIDLSGNANIHAPGLHVSWRGYPNRFKEDAEPSSAFAPKAARVVRWLLMHPNESFAQREIARDIQLHEAYVSQVVKGLIKAGYLFREDDKRIRVGRADVLLDAWRDAYDFSKHHIIKGHIFARTSDALVQRMAETLKAQGLEYAMTGLPAAWLVDRFASFRLATAYVASLPTPDTLAAMGFKEDSRGANTWLIVPKDDGVFHGAQTIEGIRCVHPVQAYVDLKALPERAEEAAEHLRGRILTGAERV